MAMLAQINQAYADDDEQHHTASVGYGSNDSSHSKSPLHTLIKSLTADKKTKDGQPPKRRGPKPDSKPALTRRQELNRQAQRTHRERKELYIKALEQEVLKLKEHCGDAIRDRDNFAEENRKLRDLLVANGLAHLLDSLPLRAIKAPPSSSGSISGSYAATSSASGGSPPATQQSPADGPSAPNLHGTRKPNTVDEYDQIGIEFVLALERPCMDHMQMLCVRSQKEEAEISGHALMATCPPHNHLIEHPEVQYPHQMPEMNPSDLMKLLDLSNRLPLDGEVTPVMAWASIIKDPRVNDLNRSDFKAIEVDLLTKVRCYGFGAVLEEFEVQDAMESVFATKMEGIDIDDA